MTAPFSVVRHGGSDIDRAEVWSRDSAGVLGGGM